MYLTLSPISFSFKKPPSPSASKALSFLFLSFEETLLLRLKSLVPSPDHSPSISLSYLSNAVDVLSSIHADAQTLISDPSLSGSDAPAFASYVDSSIRLLDACNAISAEIERLQRRRLLIHFVIHLLSSPGDPPPPEKIRKARESIREWEECPKQSISASFDLIRGLAPREAPRGKISAVGRAIYAVETVSALIAGAVLEFFGQKGDSPSEVKARDGFAWAEAFNELQKAVAVGEIGKPAPEFEAVEACVRKLVDAIDGEKTESLRCAVKELEIAAAGLTEGLDRLGSAVNGLFRAALSTRNMALHGFRVGPQKCR